MGNQLDQNPEILEKLGGKPSPSEERGLSLLQDSDLLIFSPGISTAGFAEIRMARQVPNRKVIATTIDQKGLDFARGIIENVGLDTQIETRLEDLREPSDYAANSIDFIYSRLVLHYLSAQELNSVLSNFYKMLKPGGRVFIVVRSVDNIPIDPDVDFDPETKLTTIPHKNPDGSTRHVETRYFHTLDSIQSHLELAGFKISDISESKEQLYKDFMRVEPAPRKDFLIEVVVHKPDEA